MLFLSVLLFYALYFTCCFPTMFIMLGFRLFTHYTRPLYRVLALASGQAFCPDILRAFRSHCSHPATGLLRSDSEQRVLYSGRPGLYTVLIFFVLLAGSCVAAGFFVVFP